MNFFVKKLTLFVNFCGSINIVYGSEKFYFPELPNPITNEYIENLKTYTITAGRSLEDGKQLEFVSRLQDMNESEMFWQIICSKTPQESFKGCTLQMLYGIAYELNNFLLSQVPSYEEGSPEDPYRIEENETVWRPFPYSKLYPFTKRGYTCGGRLLSIA